VTSKKTRRVTSKQVAQHAGVSQTTVSFVLNNVEDANISAETKARVLHAARELNYIPDVAAQSLARGRSNNIAFVLAKPHPQVFMDEYFTSLLTGMTSVARANGFRIMVELVESGELAQVYTNLLRSKEAAGVIVNHNGISERDLAHIVAAGEDNLPIVSTVHLHPSVYSAQVDKMNGVRMMVHHLLSLGHRRIACISYAPQGNDHADQRIAVIREMLAEVGCPLDERLVGYGAFDPDTGYNIMQTLLQVRPLPTAVFALNDMMAFGALRAIYECRLRVPQDIAVVGFDDIRVAQFITPPLTTIHEPDIEHGRLAAELLMALMRGEAPTPRQIMLDTRLIVRESCGGQLQQN